MSKLNWLDDNDSFMRINDSFWTNSTLGKSGLYCIKLRNNCTLPPRYNDHLKEDRMLYIGKAKELEGRLKQELLSEGHGTFFRSIGAVLGYRPKQGSLINHSNKRNYKFSQTDTRKIISWLSENVEINTIACDDLSIEKGLIRQYCPLINLANNPKKLSILEKDRKVCCEIANSCPR